jgi:mRNA interferase HigB
MRIITRSTLKKFYALHPKSESGLEHWYKQTNEADWKSLQDIRKIFPSADLVDDFIVFNICGNSYRLITRIRFHSKKVFIRNVLTHADYDKNRWKNDGWYEQ